MRVNRNIQQTGTIISRPLSIEPAPSELTTTAPTYITNQPIRIPQFHLKNRTISPPIITKTNNLNKNYTTTL